MTEFVDKEKIKKATSLLLEGIGENPKREELIDTWKRRVPSMWEELSEGYREVEKPDLKTFKTGHDEMVVKKDIKIFSLCEHHLIPFIGRMHIGYIPDGEIIGISKLTRYAQWHSRKLTNQESLTRNVSEGLVEETNISGAIVVLEARHLCEQMRGVESDGSMTKTRSATGLFEEDRYLKKEFLSYLK
ncbi:MAG: GTP cyclohydrolase I [Candidatus Nanohaloarchaea archaeon]|nr:GTP cyclohydrolase I [Candidatus Nanohaloarchaea archaeon]